MHAETHTGSGFGFEGLEFRDNLTIINDIGLIVDSVAVHDLVKLIGNNFNNLKRNVFIRNMHNVHIIANLFYAYPDYKNRDWKAVELYNDDPNLSEFGASNIIQGNSFHTFSVPTQNKIGITISATSNASTSTIIDANQFTSLTQVGLLGPGSNNIKFTDTNVITATPIGLKDLGASNIVARYVAAATGYRRANDGAVTAWGTASLIVDGSGNVTVPLSGNVARAFRETPYVALAQNSFPSASASRVISWNQAASTASQLVFHVDGAAPNDNFQISWRAEGH